MEKLMEDLIKSLKDSVGNCQERIDGAMPEKDDKYWIGARNAYQHTLEVVECEFNHMKKLKEIDTEQEELKQNWRGSK